MYISLSTAGPKWRQRFNQTRLCSGQGALHSLLQVRMSICLWLVQAFSMRLLLILRKTSKQGATQKLEVENNIRASANKNEESRRNRNG